MQIQHNGKPVTIETWNRLARFQKVCRHIYGVNSFCFTDICYRDSCKRCGLNVRYIDLRRITQDSVGLVL